jgi:ABC-type antimicrobial peptide transport system permease subunit
MVDWLIIMSSAGFPINDLLRRKLQTSLTVATLTLSVASTLFLLLFSSRLGLGIASTTGTLTLGLTAIFSQFVLLTGILVFVIGAVFTSFIVFLMMSQRTRDFGLMKAAGCPNSLVGGYFMTELLIVTFVGCVLGLVFGFLADFAVAEIVFSGYTLPFLWFAPLVFVIFFVLALFFGLQPLLKASKLSPATAISPVNYYGLTAATKHKALPRSGLSWRLASRSLIRRQSASLHIIVLLSIVFILLTVSIAGGIIASGSDTVAVAQVSMGNQFKMLLEKFSGAKIIGNFNYSDPDLAVPTSVIEQLNSSPYVNLVDPRLIVNEHVVEVGNFTIDPDTLATFPVGDSRQGESIIIGVDPQKLVSSWSIKGKFLSGNDTSAAVIGDSISQTMYAPQASKYVVLADPLLESISFQNTSFPIVGISVDPINNGFVTYVSISKLENVTGIPSPNLLLVKLTNSDNRTTSIAEIRNIVQSSNPNLEVFDLKGAIEKNTSFLSSNWQTIMLLPLFSLASSALCLVGYMMLSVDEQHQEFAILRAVGAKPKIILRISAIQSAIVLFSSFAVGLSLGIITTVLILMTNPKITSVSLLEISVWLLAALAAMLLLSLYPGYRLAKTSILKIMT